MSTPQMREADVGSAKTKQKKKHNQRIMALTSSQEEEKKNPSQKPPPSGRCFVQIRSRFFP
jgi:hypothetical protein